MNATTDTTDIKPARSKFVKTNIPNLVRLVPSETYYDRCKVGGKLVRESLKTTVFAVAKKKLPLWWIGARGRTTNSDVAMGAVIEACKQRLNLAVDSRDIRRELHVVTKNLHSPVPTVHQVIDGPRLLHPHVAPHFPHLIPSPPGGQSHIPTSLIPATDCKWSGLTRFGTHSLSLETAARI